MAEWLSDGRQIEVFPTGNLHVVQSNNTDVIRNGQSSGENCIKRTNRQYIVATEIGLLRGFGNQPGHFIPTGIERIGRCIAVAEINVWIAIKHFCESEKSIDAGCRSGWATQEANMPVSTRN